MPDRYPVDPKAQLGGAVRVTCFVASHTVGFPRTGRSACPARAAAPDFRAPRFPDTRCSPSARTPQAVCRAWRETCGQLGGTTNVEGRFAAGVGVPWLHVELGNGLRTEPARRAVVAGVLAETARSWGPRP